MKTLLYCLMRCWMWHGKSRVMKFKDKTIIWVNHGLFKPKMIWRFDKVVDAGFYFNGDPWVNGNDIEIG